MNMQHCQGLKTSSGTCNTYYDVEETPCPRCGTRTLIFEAFQERALSEFMDEDDTETETETETETKTETVVSAPLNAAKLRRRRRR